MPDNIYCYPNSNILINKLNIKNEKDLFEAEKELTAIRLRELQRNPIKGNFDFQHLKSIHKYIFQDIYNWAGEIRTVEIGKGNLFCTTSCINSYANSVFQKYYLQCYASKDDFRDFIRVFSENYGDLNALHPFREGNGRTQREFARLICLKCGYDFDLSCTTHSKMLEASKLSFNKGDSSLFVEIFSKAITAYSGQKARDEDIINILTQDDLTINVASNYDYYGYNESVKSKIYDEFYKAKISKMNAEKAMNEIKSHINTIQKNEYSNEIKVQHQINKAYIKQSYEDER